MALNELGFEDAVLDYQPGGIAAKLQLARISKEKQVANRDQLEKFRRDLMAIGMGKDGGILGENDRPVDGIRAAEAELSGQRQSF